MLHLHKSAEARESRVLNVPHMEEERRLHRILTKLDLDIQIGSTQYSRNLNVPDRRFTECKQ